VLFIYFILLFLIYIDNSYYRLKTIIPKLLKDKIHNKLENSSMDDKHSKIYRKNSISNLALKNNFSRVSSASSRSNDFTDIDYSNCKYIDI